MRHVLVIVVDIPAMLAPQVTIIRYFDIPAMLAPQNTVFQIHLILYIINKKEKQNKKVRGAEPNPTKLSKIIGMNTNLSLEKTTLIKL